MADARDGTGEHRRSVGAAALVGVGLMAAVDEIVFHQVLGWHHFYDRSTPDVALLSDGLLHAAELVVLVAGAFLLADLVRRRALVPVAAWAGGLLGAGGFQLLDGVVNHKVLRLHQVRYDVDLLPYDVAWNGFAVALLVAGLVLLLRSRRVEATGGGDGPGDDGRDDGTRARTDARLAGGRETGGRRAAGAHAAEGPAPGSGRTHAAERPARPAVRARVDDPPPTPPRGRRRAPGPATGALPVVPPQGPGTPGPTADAPRRRRDDRPSGRRAADP